MTSTATLLHICLRNCSFESAGGIQTHNIILCSFPPSFTCYDTVVQTCVYATVFSSFMWPYLLQQHQLQSAGFCALCVFAMLQPVVCNSTPCLYFLTLRKWLQQQQLKGSWTCCYQITVLYINMCMLMVHFQTVITVGFSLCAVFVIGDFSP